MKQQGLDVTVSGIIAYVATEGSQMPVASSTSPSSSSMSTNTLVVILATALGAVLVIGAAIWFLHLRRRRGKVAGDDVLPRGGISSVNQDVIHVFGGGMVRIVVLRTF